MAETKTSAAKTAAKKTTEKVEKTNNTAEKTVEKTEKVYSASEVEALIAKAVAEALKNQSPSVVQVLPEEKVTLMFVGGIAKGTVVAVGTLGKITRDCGMIEVPKKDFLQNIGDEVIDSLLAERKLVVIAGLDDEERERYGVMYREGELIQSDAFYKKLLDLNTDDVCDVFAHLCETHKQILARVFITAFAENNDGRVTLEKCKALNKISKKTDKDGLFTHILEDMGRDLASEE